MATSMKAYKFRIYPTKEQQERIFLTLNLCRWLYNSGLEQRITAYKKQKKSLSCYAQMNELPEVKRELPEFKKVHSQVLQNVMDRLDKSYQSFFARIKRGDKAGFPRFQGRNRYNSFTYPQSGFSVTGKSVKLSKIGEIRIKQHRKVEGTIKTCTITHKNGCFFVCFSCEVQTSEQLVDKQNTVGIDLGVKHLAITSNGVFYENPKHLQRLERKLQKQQRAISKKKRGSNRRKKAVLQLAKLHEFIANKRKDTAHKISRKLVNSHDLIVFENLDIQRMIQNHRYAKHITDSAWRQLINYTTYKAENAGKEVRLVNPYNTTQQCSNCEEIVKKTIADRIHRCDCGYTEDRDVNAARNILRIGLGKAA